MQRKTKSNKKNKPIETLTGQAAVFIKAGQSLDLRVYPVGHPDKNDALLKLERSGVCGTDVHIFEGRLAIPGPFIPGHEFIGRMIEIGRAVKTDGLGQKIKTGDLAIACVALSCGKCFNCRRGETASCLNFGVTYVKDPNKPPHFFGGFSEYLFHPAASLVRIPDDLNIDAVSAFPCAGPTVIRAFEYAGGLEKGDIIVVQGTGPVGLFAIAYASKAGCSVIAIGSGKDRRRVSLANKLGAKYFWDYRKSTLEERLIKVKKIAKSMNRGDGADIVFEASGSPSAVNEGLSLVRTRGRYLIPGQYSISGGINIDPQIITFKAIRIIGSGQYTLKDIGAYIEFLKGNRDLSKPFADCITHQYPVCDANDAWKNASKGLSIKGVFIS